MWQLMDMRFTDTAKIAFGL